MCCAAQNWNLMPSPAGRDIILAVNVPQNNWFVHICLCHKLQTTLTFLVNMSYHVHITWLWPDFLIVKRRVWWWSYRPEACQVTKVQECVSTFIKIDIHDVFKETLAQFPLVFCATHPFCRNAHHKHLFWWLALDAAGWEWTMGKSSLTCLYLQLSYSC